MFDPHEPWPFGLTAKNWRRRAGWTLVGLYLVSFADGPLSNWAKHWPDLLRGPFAIITRAGNSDWILIPSLVLMVAAWAWAKLDIDELRRRTVREAAAIAAFLFVGVAGTGLAVNLVKRIVGRARPVHFDQFGVWHFHPNLARPDFQSFPSGDTTTIFAFAMLVSFLEPRLRPALLTFAALVGIARVVTGWHYPSDVLGGVILGTLGAYAVRNFFADRDWLFVRNRDGSVARKPQGQGGPTSWRRSGRTPRSDPA